MEGVIENAEAIGGKVGEKLRDNIDLLRLSYELATIKMDVVLDVKIPELVAGQADKQKLHELFSEMEFKSWIRELEDQCVAGAPKSKKTASKEAAGEEVVVSIAEEDIDYKLVVDAGEFAALVDQVSASSSFSISLETIGDHFLDQEILGIALCMEIGKAFYIPFLHYYDDVPAQLDSADCLAQLKPILVNPSIVKVGFDLKHLDHVLKNHEITIQPIKKDVHLASYVANSVVTKHQLPQITRNYLEVTPIAIESLLGKGRGKLSREQVALADYASYAAQKADHILRLSAILQQTLSSNGNLLGLYQYYELPLIEVLNKVERNGIRVDAVALAKQSKQIGKQLGKLQLQVFEIAGEEFNLSSPKQLQTIFYEKLELPILKKTKTGQPSTAEPVLQELAQDYEMPKLILEHRSLNKLKSTYTDKLPLEINKGTGRIHSSFQQAVTATGRLSSTDPNLQNIPIRTAEGRRVRQAFICDPGNKMLAADYSQVELRIMAHLSQDEGLLNAFSNAQDVHKATAADVFGVALDEVSIDQRRSAKAINFGLIYGMSAFGLANQLNISRGEAAEYVDRYFEKYPGVRKYMDETQALADEKGYVETLFGRRLYLPDIHAGNGMLRKAAQRTAINAPMQGTAADIIKRAMIDIDNWLAMGELDARMLLQVHDELVFEVSEKDLDQLTQGVKFRMTSAAALDVPLVVDVGVGDNWDEAH